MSSILKALEKVERERVEQRDGIGESFLKPRPQRSPWMLPLGIISGAVLAALVTFAAMGGFTRHASAPAAVAVVAPATAPKGAAGQEQARARRSLPTPPVAAVAPRRDVRTTALAADAASTPVRTKPAKIVVRPVREAAQKPAVVRPQIAAVKAQSPTVARVQQVTKTPPAYKQEPSREKIPAAQPAVVPSSSAAATAPLPDIQVTGIAVQNEGTSFAIVNGRPVAKGGTVEGCRVEEIHQDRVKFSSGGRNFDVRLDENAH